MYDAHSDEPWVLELLDLLRDIWTKRPQILLSGVCFGHQIISRMLGAKVEPTASGKWELAHTEMTLSPVGQKLFRTEDKTLRLHQMHQDQVTTRPSAETSDLLSKDQKVHVWASTDHTEIQGLYIHDRIFTSQGHLGFDEKIVQRQIEARQKSGGIKDCKHAAKAKETAHMKHDGVVVAGAILRFFHGQDHDVD
jgi:GMP synthase-like glutamine amidotransferase